MQKSLIPSLFFAFLVFSPSLTIAQTIAGTSKLTSPTDQSLTIKKVLILPAQDNIDGLYANPLRQELGKIIACSTIDQEMIVVQALDAGCCDYLAKPFEGAQVGRAIRRAVGEA